MRRRTFTRAVCAIAALAVGALSAAPVQAQSYPDKPIRLIAPFPPGGLADTLARLVGEQMSKTLGQPIVVENRTGAGGNVGADAVAKAEPDGYTLLMSSAGIVTANQFLYAKMPFDPETAFAPISIVADMSMMVVVNPAVEAKNLGEFVALAKKQPGKITFGSPGVGTTGHLGLAMFMHAAGIDLNHVPYRGAGPAVADLIGGQINGVVDNPPTVLPHIKAGKLRPLAVAANERLALLPDVPTAAEAGLQNFEASSWFGIMAPARTPKPVIERLHKAMVAALKEPAVAERIASSAARAVGNTPEEFAKRIVAERKRWGEIIKAANITPQ
jgi:tripartite-type tricarboxylate transporter receptor subunit TctC